MNKRSHLLVTGKIAEQIPEKGRNWFLLGSILPDLLYHTYWKGHMFESSFDSISKKMCELEKHGRDNRFSYLILGYILHYVEDFYTLAHNPVFEGSLPSHILYERQLEEYLKEEDRFPGNENDSVMSMDATLQYLRDEHKEYLKEAGNFETDKKYIYNVSQVVSKCLLRAFAMNEQESQEPEGVPIYMFPDYHKVRL